MSAAEPTERPRHLWRARPGAMITRLLNPRYAGLPAGFFHRPVRILDAGSGPKDALIARRLFATCWFEGINIADLPPDSMERQAFDRYHLIDLDHTDLGFVPDAAFDYVICSHTIEHLADGIALVPRLCAKVQPGGRLYIEWPSVASQTFPLRGVGLSFFDDATHQQTFPVEAVATAIRKHGLEVEYAGPRRQIARMLLSPALAAYHTLCAKRLLLYDLWDLTGACSVVRATRPHRA